MKLFGGLRSFRKYFGLTLVVAFMLVVTNEVYSQFTRPIAPRLSLTGVTNSYDTDFYPDGRIWVPPTVSGAREFLMPVFITNNWYSYKNAQGVSLFTVDPIKSFSFSLFYNDKAVKYVGVETVNSVYIDPGYEPLAQQFYIDSEDEEDDYYWYYINPGKWSDTRDNLDGRRVTFNGVSMGTQLPNTDLDVEEFKVLFYVRFRVIAERKPQDSEFSRIQTTPIYIDNRNVVYNDLNIAKDNLWLGFTDYDVNTYLDHYSWSIIGNNRGRLDGDLFYPDYYLDGMNNAPTSEDENATLLPGPLSDISMFNAEPVYPGVITLKITDDIPVIRVASITDDVFENDGTAEAAATLFKLPGIVLVDDNSPEQFGIARMKISNATSKSRLQNIWFESDSPWLEMRKDELNVNRTFNLPGNQGRYGYASYLDNSILGAELDPMLKPTQDDGDIYIRIECDPNRLPAISGEPHGIHVGYITIKSDFAKASPVRVQVMFIYMKNPYEPDWNKAPGQPGGINITLRNSSGAVGQTKKLVFGTGTRATDGVDNLYGELAWNTPLSNTAFDARWFPVDPALQEVIPFGFRDIAPNMAAPRTVSRDIRAYNLDKGQNSHIYECRFYNPDNAYPITVEWDVNDFPQGAQLFIRQVVNGEELQATNMREATKINDNVRSITITDRNVRSFRIEYTLPHVLKFVDEFGNPIIKRGWNLLSMPLAPTNSTYDVVYKNAINIPWAFVNSQYQQRNILKFGEGYFVKYSSIVDTIFAGAYERTITKSKNNIRVWAGDIPDPGFNQFNGGWNLVGALSVPTSINGIAFEAADNNQLPVLSYTKSYGAYAYKTGRGYYEVSNLIPGFAYWIKVSSDGYYGLREVKDKLSISEVANTKQDIIARSTKVLVNDNAQNSKEVYFANANVNTEFFELPPVFSPDMFDVRFNNNAYIANTDESVMHLQGVTFPVSLTINNADADYTFYDAATNAYIGSIKAGSSEVVRIDELAAGSVKVLKQGLTDGIFSVSAYPVPANDFTNINFNIVENDYVTVKLFDVLGNEVAEFVNEFKTKGSYTETVSLKGINPGNYMLKVQSGANNAVVKINVVR